LSSELRADYLEASAGCQQACRLVLGFVSTANDQTRAVQHIEADLEEGIKADTHQLLMDS
jgi:hypothetical protein